MAKGSKREKAETEERPSGAWLPTRTGLYVLTFVSLALAAWTTWQVSRALSLLESVLWGIGFGGSIWVIFLGVFLLNRFLRRG